MTHICPQCGEDCDCKSLDCTHCEWDDDQDYTVLAPRPTPGERIEYEIEMG